MSPERSSPGVTVRPGSRFGPYEVRDRIGIGGMGEVYRARDAKLGRDVAIKVLPLEFTSDPDRLERFEREARVLATLNHPNIGAIYGSEEADGLRGLVLELVEGETLGEHIARAGSVEPPIPIEEALTIAQQIADALEAAHEKGIVHRDLKPANIKITPAGVVKVIDFGLAKTMAIAASARDLSQAPTVIIGGTLEGVILGTIAYMSPEQARGKAVDKRTDIWAFGCVLYEMLTGRPPFTGDTISDTIAGILDRDPDWSALPASTPPAVRRLLKRCLDKDPKRRLHDIADTRVEIEDALIEPLTSPASAAGVRKSRVWLWIAATVVMIVALVVSAAYNRSEPAEAHETRLQIVTPTGTDLTSFALSPDGFSIVFQAEGKLLLWPLDSDGAPQPLAGAEGGSNPFWKPDSKSIGFCAGGKLKTIDLSRLIVRELASAPNYCSGTWSEAGIILFSASNTGPLFRVTQDGTELSEVTRVAPPHTNHRFPHFLPDGRHFLFFARGTPESNGVYLGSLDSTESRPLFAADSAAVFAPPDYVLFARQGVLLAQRLNLETLERVGDPSPVAGRVGQARNFVGAVAVSTSAAGPIAYQTEGRTRQLIWVDRLGHQVSKVGEQDASQYSGLGVGLSPNGSVAVSRTVNGSTDIWLLETGRRPYKFTSDLANEFHPVWSFNNDRIAFGSDRMGTLDLYEAPINGNGTATVLVESLEPKTSLDWSRDGRFFLYTSQNPKTGNDLWVKPLLGDNKEPYELPNTNTPRTETGAKFSPDSRWITYEQSEGRRLDVYVQPFGRPGRRLPISSNGGYNARWRGNGREVFYLERQNENVRLMAVSVTPDAPTIDPGPPKELFVINGEFVGASSDGQKFLFNTFVDTSVPITVLLNWKPPSK